MTQVIAGRIDSKTYRPSGLRRDGPTFAYEELPVLTGRHLLLDTSVMPHSNEDSQNQRLLRPLSKDPLTRSLLGILDFAPGSRTQTT